MQNVFGRRGRFHAETFENELRIQENSAFFCSVLNGNQELHFSPMRAHDAAERP